MALSDLEKLLDEATEVERRRSEDGWREGGLAE